MSELEKEQAKFQAAPVNAESDEAKQEEGQKQSFLPSWWVKQPKPEKVKKPIKQELIEWGFTLVVALLIAFVARSFIFEPVRVDGDSMYPTLHHGEFMYVSKLEYGTSFIGIPFTGIGKYFTVGGEPERFDVVVCNYPDRLNKNGSRLNFVKRVVGLPGDTVQFEDSALILNGRPLSEPYVITETEDMSLTLGPDEYFLLGDNRAESYDSRAEDMGCIGADRFLGRAVWILWPINRFGPVE